MKWGLKLLTQLLNQATTRPWQEFCESGDWWVAQVDEEGGPLQFVCDSNHEIWKEQADLDLAITATNAAGELVNIVLLADRVVEDYYYGQPDDFNQSMNKLREGLIALPD